MTVFLFLSLSNFHGLQPTRLLHPWDFLGKSTCKEWLAIAFSDKQIRDSILFEFASSSGDCENRVHVKPCFAIFLLLHWEISKKRNVITFVCVLDQVLLILKLILNYQNLSSIWLKQADICQLLMDRFRKGIMETSHSKFIRA